ncbi:RsfA family transcriptional regulator [Paenibacillus sp. HN-1]|uniref:RsfA family transcriptional regulator n=1 Tax=Paenibacillus TaxID=44249 RepID=UPI001CAA31EC|nr:MULTISPECIES: RsfA family transcriptional regulator [Paenibacillus]MBY9076947.1 RsfA family transcriptional regulator [Paenibacillus sp. CGMCC 1.18879]MBY9086212.1 RsfA family transcriptional regulator [Paenibacillus sinensis]
MTAIRQDAWSEEDDLVLAEVTLRHIREGSTQLAAFEEVGEKIGRTSAACGFRWNSCVRKSYEEAISIAKGQRQKRNYLKKQGVARGAQVAGFGGGEGEEPFVHEEAQNSLSIDAVIRFLRQWKGTYQEAGRQLKMLERDLREKEEELADLRAENERLSKEVNTAQSDYRVVNDDYKALIQIMDRARRLAFLNEDEEEIKNRFKMDANGNLERID